MQYAKPAIPITQQLALLQSRGLLITDVGEAERALARLIPAERLFSVVSNAR